MLLACVTVSFTRAVFGCSFARCATLPPRTTAAPPCQVPTAPRCSPRTCHTLTLAHTHTRASCPPLSPPGRVPDQPASSANFVALLTVYRTKRDSHVAWLLEAANRHAQRCGARAVTQEEAKDMVEFSSFTIVINGTSLGQEFGPGCVGRSCRIARCTQLAALCAHAVSLTAAGARR